MMNKVLRPVEEIRAAAIAFNKALKIPVRWRVAERIPSSSRLVKMRRSTHVLLLEDINEGRFKRRRGEFLCKASITNPKAHQALNVVDIHHEKSKYKKVECAKCIEIARKRWR
jgi:hypothetical protein